MSKCKGPKKPRQKKSLRERFEAKYQVNPDTGCWEWTACTDVDGYGRFWVPRKKHWKAFQAHRISYYLRHGPIHGIVRHKCDNPKCVNPDHLVSGSQHDNIQDAKERNPTFGQNRLDLEKAREIRARYAEGGITYAELGREYDVSGTAIRRVVKNQAWKEPEE